MIDSAPETLRMACATCGRVDAPIPCLRTGQTLYGHACLDWLECGACGGTAVRAELDGTWPNAGACGECLCPGWVELQPDGAPAWITDVPDGADAPYTLRSRTAADPAVDA